MGQAAAVSSRDDLGDHLRSRVVQVCSPETVQFLNVS